MKFHIPFAFSEVEKLKTRSKSFLPNIKYRKNSKLRYYLENSNLDITREEYITIVIRNFLINFTFLFIISTTFLILFKIEYIYFLAPIIPLIFALFILFSQLVYPRIYLSRRQKNIERNLIPALQDILVQLTSGVPLFSVLINISAAKYGELSIEFKKAVKKINAGMPEQEVLDDLAENNPSVFFKKALWQISNGMNAGSDLAIVVKDSIKALNNEQMIQIQEYGNKLNPLIVFYMLVAIIIPALSIAFLTIITSIIGIPSGTVKMIFIILFIFVMLIQIMFLGLIRSKRPTLL